MDKQHYLERLKNHGYYHHAYMTAAGQVESDQTRRAMAEAATHAMTIAWSMHDHHVESEYADPIAAAGWLVMAHRWSASLEKASRKMPSNQRRAYDAARQERKVIEGWPIASTHGAPTGGSGRAASAPSEPHTIAGPGAAIDASSPAAPETASTAANGATSDTPVVDGLREAHSRERIVPNV